MARPLRCTGGGEKAGGGTRFRPPAGLRSEEHTSELQSRQYLPSFPTRRSSDLKFAPGVALQEAGGHSSQMTPLFRDVMEKEKRRGKPGRAAAIAKGHDHFAAREAAKKQPE